jgi:hypothetical protein
MTESNYWKRGRLKFPSVGWTRVTIPSNSQLGSREGGARHHER